MGLRAMLSLHHLENMRLCMIMVHTACTPWSYVPHHHVMCFCARVRFTA